MKKKAVKLLLGILAGVTLIIQNVLPAYALMQLPDTDPSITELHIYRNVLEQNDFFVFFLENTTYNTTSSLSPYSQAYTWHFTATNGTSYGDAIGYDFNDNGYGYNVIGFYWDNSTAPAWGQAYQLVMEGTAGLFTSTPTYTFDVLASNVTGNPYSATTANVTVEISNQVLEWAQFLDREWALATAYRLMGDGDYLSAQGSIFFSGAVYGMQGLAPEAFEVIISAIDAADRTWGNSYVTALQNMYAGTYMATAITSGQSFFNVSYNLLGLILVLAVCVVIIIANWMLAGGFVLRGFIECAAPLVILSRVGMIGFGEMALIVAVCWIYLAARMWRII